MENVSLFQIAEAVQNAVDCVEIWHKIVVFGF